MNPRAAAEQAAQRKKVRAGQSAHGMKACRARCAWKEDIRHTDDTSSQTHTSSFSSKLRDIRYQTHAHAHSEFAATDLKSVGNYTLGRLIGKGSFGKVYLASHKLSNGSKVLVQSTHALHNANRRRSSSSQPRKTTPTSRARSTTTASLSTRTSHACTRS